MNSSSRFQPEGRALAAADAERNERGARMAAAQFEEVERTSRAPVAPTGWPSAIAPPLTLSRASSIGRSSSRRSLRTARTCAAKASLISTRSASIDRVAAALLELFHGVHGAEPHPRGIAAGVGVIGKISERRQAEFRGALLAADEQRDCAIGDLRAVAGRDGAKAVEGGPQFREHFERLVVARAVVGGNERRRALLAREIYRA